MEDDEKKEDKNIKVNVNKKYNKKVITISVIAFILCYSIVLTISYIHLIFKYDDLKKSCNIVNPGEVSGYTDCGKSLKGYDALFFYTPIDNHSKNMMNLVKNSNLKFYWINVYDKKCDYLKTAKYGYIGWIPYFYCLHNGLNYTGEMTNSTWNWFINNCGG